MQIAAGLSGRLLKQNLREQGHWLDFYIGRETGQAKG